MTPEERLKQIEVLFETAARYTVRHEEVIARHEEVIARLDEQIIETKLQLAELASIMQELSRYQRESQERIDSNQAEIRRIWEYLSSQSGNGRSSK